MFDSYRFIDSIGIFLSLESVMLYIIDGLNEVDANERRDKAEDCCFKAKDQCDKT